MRQLKEVQRREDAEFVELMQRDQTLSQADIQRCVEEQKRHEAAGQPKVLRRIAVELGLIAPTELKAILRKKVRDDIEQHLSEWGGTRRRSPAKAIMPEEDDLKLNEIEPCPACGRKVRVGTRVCPSCGRRVEEARREVARRGGVPMPGDTRATHALKARRAGRPRQPTDRWELRLPSGEASRSLPFAAIVKLTHEKRIKARTVLRGPLTRGVWRQARHTPKLCRLFGTCHYCEGRLPPNAEYCPTCQTDPDQPRDS
jgi:hypothetical protein